jgi:hypothetical protein
MFNWIVQYSLRNRLFVLAFAALLMVYGVLTAWRTRRRKLGCSGRGWGGPDRAGDEIGESVLTDPLQV